MEPDDDLSHLPYYAGQAAEARDVSGAHLKEFNCSTTKRVSIPTDTSSGSSLIDASNADGFGIDTIPTAEISTMENQPRAV